jgi:hypothetical protein
MLIANFYHPGRFDLPLNVLGDKKAERLSWPEQTKHNRALAIQGTGQGFVFPLGPLILSNHSAGNMCLSEAQDQPRSLL